MSTPLQQGIVRYLNRSRQRVAVSTDAAYSVFVVVAGPWPKRGALVQGELTRMGHSTLRLYGVDTGTLEVHVEAAGISGRRALELTR